MNDLQKRIQEVFRQIFVIQLATVRDGQPWVCNVHAFMDADFNIYWVSKLDRRHSKEIADNPRVGAASAVQTKKPLLGVQLEGNAKLITNQDEIKRVMELFGQHHGSSREWLDDIISGNNPHRLYCLTPSKIAIFDQITFPDDPLRVWENETAA